MKNGKFYICKLCGNIVFMVRASGVPIMCCGEAMSEISANTSDGAVEKHVPVVSLRENILEVNVGSIPHPMTAEHYIEWIYVETKSGGQMKKLNPEDKPYATFVLDNDEPIAVYAYCNLHSLWKGEI